MSAKSPAPTTRHASPAEGEHVVVFDAPPGDLNPSTLRAAFAAFAAFVAMLPETVTPAAAVGRATRETNRKGMRWVHAGQSEGASRWILTNATVDDKHAILEGWHGVACEADGKLLVDASIPLDVADEVRTRYDNARNVVEPAKLNAALARWCGKRGLKLRDGAYLLSRLDAETAGIVAATVALGGLASTFPVGGAALQALAAPAQRAIEDEAAEVLRQCADVVAKAKAAQDKSGPTLKTGEDGDLSIRETAHRDLDAVRERLTTWRDRLGLVLHDVAATLADAETTLDVECDRALAAIDARKAARRAGGSTRGTTPLDRAA